MKRLVQILTKLNPSYTSQKGDHYEMELPNKSSIPAVELFKEKRALSTVMIWATFFMCLLMVYGLNTWLPKLMETAGYQLGSSLLFLLVLNAGAIFGAIFGGWASDHWNGRKVLISFFVIAAISLSLLGFKSNSLVLYTIVGIAGATTIGTQIVLYSFAAQIYPIQMRSTGVGWASRIGQFGAVLEPYLGRFLLPMNLSMQQNFFAFAIPGIIAAVAIWLVREKRTSSIKASQNDYQNNETSVDIR